MPGSTFRGGYAKLADIASASAITSGLDGAYHTITGTTTINSIASKKAGTKVIFKAASSGLTFTHLTGTLNMLSKQSHTSVAGDILAFISDGAGEWSELWRNVEGGSLLVGREFTLTMETGANWFTVSSPPAVANVAGAAHTLTPSLTMPTGANWFVQSYAQVLTAGAAQALTPSLTMPTGAAWFTTSFATTAWACQCHLCC